MTTELWSFLWMSCLLLSYIQNKYIVIANKKIDGRGVYLFLFFAIILLVMGGRAPTVGGDTWNYAVNIFSDISGEHDVFSIWENEEATGRVFWSFFYMVSSLSVDPQMYIFMVSLVICLGTAYFIYKTSDDVAVPSFVFLTATATFFVQGMTAARQFFGIVLAINAFLLLWKNWKSIIGWVLLFASFGVHAVNVAFVLAILGAFLSRKIRNPWRLFWGTSFLSFLGVTLIQALLPIIVGIVIPQYAGYFEASYDQNVFATEAGYGFGVFMTNAIFFLIAMIATFLLRKRGLQDDERARLIFAMIPGAVCAAVCGMLLSGNMVAPRIVNSMAFLILPIASYCAVTLKGNAKWVYLIWICLALSIVFFRQPLVQGYVYEAVWW